MFRPYPVNALPSLMTAHIPYVPPLLDFTVQKDAFLGIVP